MNTRRSLGDDHDLASVTALENVERANAVPGLSVGAVPKGHLADSSRDGTWWSLWGQGAAFRANAFKDFAGDGGYGVSTGILMAPFNAAVQDGPWGSALGVRDALCALGKTTRATIVETTDTGAILTLSHPMI
jgi:hypothetical protein